TTSSGSAAACGSAARSSTRSATACWAAASRSCALCPTRSLVHALTCFSDRGINLTRLDSRPVPNQPWQYRFYVDFEISDPQAASDALKALEEEATEFKLFGSYPAAE